MYNRDMGGVDLLDRILAHYPHAVKGKRWYLQIFFNFFNMAVMFIHEHYTD